VDVTSLAFQTDLALLQLGGTHVEDRGDYLIVRSPHNPMFWWGNYLLLETVPPAKDADRWLARFAAEFPHAAHVALGFDGIDGSVEQLSGFTTRGLTGEASTVMTASAVHEPPRPNREATYRRLVTDEDWARSIELRVACRDDNEEVSYREFATSKVATNRAMSEDGNGGWFGAFLDGELVTQMGLFAASAGLARFQAVETHPDVRGRGLAGTLVHVVSQFGFDQLGARRLVMVADPDYVAARVYRAVGFSDGEIQLQAERAPRD
jgi:RimJ/RimL family protein N-acetyltransferase